MREAEVDHKLAPKLVAEAAVEVAPEAEVGATVGLKIRIIPETALRLGSHNPPKGLHLGEG